MKMKMKMWMRMNLDLFCRLTIATVLAVSLEKMIDTDELRLQNIHIDNALLKNNDKCN